MMQYFFDTMETIPDGVGFSLFDKTHLFWLCVFAVVTVSNCVLYQKGSVISRKRWRCIVAALLIADELFKIGILLVSGNFFWTYLPLHLCSMNVFCILWHVAKPAKWLGNFLYTVCIPGAMAALLFPAWKALPFANAMHIHSFTAHILLVLYPLVLTVSGEIKPDIRKVPVCLGLLVLLAVPIYGLNRLLNTNFMFLMYAGEGNPLRYFERYWGNHLWGFPVITAVVILVMYLPVVLRQRKRQ